MISNNLPVVYVGRPSKWGNPYKKRDISNGVVIRRTAEECIELYKRFEIGMRKNNWLGKRNRAKIRKELKGKNLSCWCKFYELCHADILLEIANG